MIIALIAHIGIVHAQSSSVPKMETVTVYPFIPYWNTPVLNPNQARYHEPYVTKIVYEWIYATDQAVYEAMTSGQADIYSFSEPSILESAETNPNFNVTIVPTYGFDQVQFNFARYPYNNTYFRQGIMSLLDYNAIETTICDGGLLCTASPMFLLPQSYPQWASPQAYQYYLEHESYNLTRAMEDFEKAGLIYNPVKGQWYYPNGTAFSATFLYATGQPQTQEVAELLSSAASKINMTINTVGESVSTLISLTSVYPYSQQTYDMLWMGWAYVSNIGPLDLNFLFGYPGYTSENAGGFYNSTIFNILNEATTVPNMTESIQLTKQAQVYLMQQLPYIMLWWGVSDTVANIHNFANYIVAPGTGISTAYVHPVGYTIDGTFYEPGLTTSAPAHMNIYSSTSAAALGVLYSFYDDPFTTNVSAPTQILPWIATWSIKTNVNTTTPRGKIVNGQIVTLNFARNVTFQDGVPLTAADYNFTLWYLDTPGITNGTNYLDGLLINYAEEANYSAPFYFGSMPWLVYTQVNESNPYQITLYLNTSSPFALYDILEVRSINSVVQRDPGRAL